MLGPMDVRTATRLAFGTALAFGAGPGAACAQEALYGKQPPIGSAFIRVVNATAAPLSIEMDDFGAMQLGAGQGDRVAPFRVVEDAAKHPVHVTAKQGGADAILTYPAPPNGTATILVEPGEGGRLVLRPVVDQVEFNQVRARLAFYNAAPGCAAASLAMEPAGTAVFDNVAAGTTKSRTVNPVQATLRAQCGGQSSPDLALAGMAIGSSYSIWLMQPGSEPLLFLTKDAAAPYKPRI